MGHLEADLGEAQRRVCAGLGITHSSLWLGEAALLGSSCASVDLAEMGRLCTEDLTPPGDVHASGELRRRIARTVVIRAVRKALSEVDNV